MALDALEASHEEDLPGDCDHASRRPRLHTFNRPTFNVQHTMPTTKTTVTVRIPTPLRSATDDESTVEVEGGTVDDALRALVNRYPDLADNLYNEDNELRQFVNVYVGDEDVRFGDGVDTILEPDDEISIVPSIAGG
jgi:molybdopterin converting factor small subunit